MIEKIIVHVHRELCAVYVPKDKMNMHINYSLSAFFVDRGAYLSISTHVKDTFEYSPSRAEFFKLRRKILTRDLECSL